MKKRLLSAVLALCMVFGSAAFLPESTFIECSGIRVSAETSDSFWYIELDDGTVQITGYKGNDSNLIIPSTINGKRVSSIGNGAFSKCTDLRSVVFENANSIDKFGSYVFYGTKWLEEQKKKNPLVVVDGILVDASDYKKNKVTIPSSVRLICDSAFEDNNYLESVVISEGVKIIDGAAFRFCNNIKNVSLPNSIEIIGGNAFYNCPSIKEIKIGRKIKEIGTWALGITYDPNKGMKVVDGFKMYCYKETVAEKYAKDLTINYTLIQNSEPKSTRLAGSNRFLTAVEISKASFDKADTVILAFGLNYADALAGVPLATKLNAPILLTAKDTLPDVTLAEINRLGAKKVIILGGTSAISEKVEKTLKTNKLKTERIAGKTRFGTATAIAEKLNEKPTDVFFVYGLNYADALSVGGIAAAKNAPIIYLTTKGELNADTAAYLAKLKGSVKNAYVIGGTGVISNDMASKAAKALGLSKAARVAGSTRFLTCVEVNKKFSDVLTGDKICVATGMDFPDALAGGVYAAKNKAPLFLINGLAKSPNLLDEQKAYLKAKSADSITTFGGTNAVPDEHITDIAKNSI